MMETIDATELGLDSGRLERLTTTIKNDIAHAVFPVVLDGAQDGRKN
jgi:hypothetical protein